MNKQLRGYVVALMIALSMLLANCNSLCADEAPAKPALAPLPEGIASFGAAVDGDWLYVYGGHLGQTHTYSKQQSSSRFQRINFKTGGAWEELPAGPGLQGLVLLAHKGQLYRIGGMTAKNEPGETEDLHSLVDFARFDPRTKKWSELAPLPEGRSSHGAAMVGDKLYVFGGWKLRGAGNDRPWSSDVLTIDLASDKPEWKSIGKVPFQRRAMAATALDGKIYVTGGLLAKGGISKEVDVFDTKTEQWSTGPEIPGMPMNGNGLAACSTADGLYLSGMDGKVYQLNGAKDGWLPVGKLERARIHHRLLPIGDRAFLAVAGATMAGNLKTVDPVTADGQK